MPVLEDLYSQRILELAGNIAAAPRLERPDGTATLHSKLCGSTVTVDLKLCDGRVTEYGHVVKACMLGQAAAAIMADQIIGATPETLRAVAEGMRQMLKSNAPPPAQAGWEDLAVLEPVRDYKARHTSTLLVFEAVEQALVAAEAKLSAPAALVASA